MTLRSRTLTAFGLTFLALIGALPLATSTILTERFRAIEDAEARRNVGRVEDAIGDELARLERSVGDLAFSDGNFARAARPPVPEPWFAPEATVYEALGVDLVYFHDTHTGAGAGRIRTTGADPAPLPPVLAAALASLAAPLVGDGPAEVRSGIDDLPDGLWMLALAPVRRADRSGPTSGIVGFGARLDLDRIERVGRLTHLALRIHPYSEASLHFGAAGVPAPGVVRFGDPDRDRLPAYVTLAGLDGEPAAVVEVSLDRDTWRVGLQTQRYLVGALLTISALFTLVAGITLERWVLRGLEGLTEAVSRLGRIGATGGRLVVTGGDELSTLARRINHMLAELERAEAARSQSDRRLALALEAADDGWWDWDIAGGEVYYSPRWCTMLGFSPDEFGNAPRAAMHLIHPEDRAMVEDRLRAHLSGATPGFEAEVRMRTGTGDWKWLLARGRVVERSADARAVRMVGTQTDISERKRMEARLVTSDRMASVGTLAVGVAHEISNPLSYVMSNLDLALTMLRRHPDFATTCEALVDAAEGAARVRDIVGDMKLFSRDQMDATGVDLRRVLDVAVRMTAHHVRGRARVEQDLAELPLVTGSEARLGQVVVNLILNAVQAMPDVRAADENVIRIIGRRPNPDEVVLEIRDNGAGIHADVQRRIFDPFFTTKPVGVGTGLGLYICHSLVEAFGGRIEVSSVLGEGSTFRVTLWVWGKLRGEVAA